MLKYKIPQIVTLTHEILFKEYPDIKKGYYLSMRLGLIYHQCKFKDIALTRLARWYDEVDKSGFLTFGRVARSTKTHYLDIIKGQCKNLRGKFINSYLCLQIHSLWS